MFLPQRSIATESDGTTGSVPPCPSTSCSFSSSTSLWRARPILQTKLDSCLLPLISCRSLKNKKKETNDDGAAAYAPDRDVEERTNKNEGWIKREAFKERYKKTKNVIYVEEKIWKTHEKCLNAEEPAAEHTSLLNELRPGLLKWTNTNSNFKKKPTV